jgi:hypothetical protein
MRGEKGSGEGKKRGESGARMYQEWEIDFEDIKVVKVKNGYVRSIYNMEGLHQKLEYEIYLERTY